MLDGIVEKLIFASLCPETTIDICTLPMEVGTSCNVAYNRYYRYKFHRVDDLFSVLFCVSVKSEIEHVKSKSKGTLNIYGSITIHTHILFISCIFTVSPSADLPQFFVYIHINK